MKGNATFSKILASFTLVILLLTKSSILFSQKSIVLHDEDTLPHLTIEQKRLFILTYNTMMYWEGEVKRLSTIDSLQSIIVKDCNTQLVQSNNTIKSLQRNVDSLNVALSETQRLYEREVVRKKRWRKTVVIGIPIGVTLGLLLSFLL